MDYSFLDNIITSVSAAVLTWFFTRKKYKAEVTFSEIENVQKAINIWHEMALDMKRSLDECEARRETVLMKFHTVNQQLIDLQHGEKKNSINTNHNNSADPAL